MGLKSLLRPGQLLFNLRRIEGGKFLQHFAGSRIDGCDRHGFTYNRSPFGIKRRSSKSKLHCINSASTAAGMAPCKIVPWSFRFRPLRIGSPKPPAPMSAARVAVPMLITALVFIPPKIERDAIGR